MTNYIKQAVDDYKSRNPDTTNHEIALKLFPDKTEQRAAYKLSRWINGYELDYVRVKDAMKICEVFNLTPNQLLQNYEQSND